MPSEKSPNILDIKVPYDKIGKYLSPKDKMKEPTPADLALWKYLRKLPETVHFIGIDGIEKIYTKKQIFNYGVTLGAEAQRGSITSVDLLDNAPPEMRTLLDHILEENQPKKNVRP